MKKFLVLYRAGAASFRKAMQSTPEQQKEGMAAWMAWGQKAHSAIVDMGAPLGKGMRVTKDGKGEVVQNDLGGYSVLQADSQEALAKLLEGHPHYLMGDDATIEVTEILPVPGM